MITNITEPNKLNIVTPSNMKPGQVGYIFKWLPERHERLPVFMDIQGNLCNLDVQNVNNDTFWSKDVVHTLNKINMFAVSLYTQGTKIELTVRN